MPSIHLPYINIAIDSFALLVTLIIFLSCFKERSRKNSRTRYFLLFLAAVSIALVSDIVAWLCEGNLSVVYLTIISNTLASCAAQFAIICFMGYLKENLYESSVGASIIFKLFSVLCAFSLVFIIGNAFYGYAFAVGEHGHWRHTDNATMAFLHFLFPVLSFFALVLMSAFARSSAKINRLAFIMYTIFPVIGIIIDYTIHGISLTYVGLTISGLVIYTNVYLQKQKLIESQRNALMLSQINPHFIYNTLSTIAAMCDISPSQAKNLTIDFSKYLRTNLSNVTNKQNVPFEEELGHTECYLKIEKARFRERLNIIYSIKCIDFELPPLSIQPLVENAVKHGITKQSEGGTIKISTYDTDTHYVVEIIDDGVGFDVESAEYHVGIENVRSRVMAMCKGDVTVKSTVGIGTRVNIEIPKKKGKAR